jgi:redox-sensitive bicupin YhaK (pirin superfamily)
MDVRPHPPIGLATVTYLFDGRVMHRDSEGNPLEITPGAMNLMTAGRGIAHSERAPGERPPRPRGAVWDPEVDCAYETPILRSNTSTPVI